MNQRLQSIAHGFAMAMRQAPGGFTRLLLLNVVGGAAPAAVLFIQKLLIDGIAGSDRGIGLAEILRSPGVLTAAVGAFLVLNVVLDAMQQILSFETSTFRDRVVGGTKRLILSAVRRLRGVRPFETPEFASRLNLAVEAVPSIDYFGKLLNDVLIGLLTVVPLVALTATLAWWVPLLMVAAIAPSMYVHTRSQIASGRSPERRLRRQSACTFTSGCSGGSISRKRRAFSASAVCCWGAGKRCSTARCEKSCASGRVAAARWSGGRCCRPSASAERSCSSSSRVWTERCPPATWRSTSDRSSTCETVSSC